MNTFVQFLNIETKKEVDHFCKRKCVTIGEFQDFLFWLQQPNLWSHQVYRHPWTPPHLRLAEGTKKKWSEGSPKFLESIQRESSYFVGHLVYLPDWSKWHFFNFDQREINCPEKTGPHIHIVNYLFPEFDGKRLWQEFTTKDDKKFSMGGRTHLRIC